MGAGTLMPILFFDHAFLPDGWASRVAVSVEAGEIAAVEAGVAPPLGCEQIQGLALPGMGNLHSHAFQRGMAGLAETRGPQHDTFWSWRQVMYRFLAHLDPEAVEAIAAYAFMEMLEGGFTALGEFHYLHHDREGRPYANPAELSERIAAAAAQSGIGLTLLPCYYAQGGFGGEAPTQGQRRFIHDIDGFSRLMDGARRAIASLPDAKLGLAPHSLRAVTPADLSALVAQMPQGPIHLHVAEQVKEVEDCLAWSGQRPMQWLLAHQPVDARWCLIHATHLTEAEARAVAASGATIGLCPLTEANLGDGIFEAQTYLPAGGFIGIGSDSNIELTASGELKQLEYSQRLKQKARNLLAGEEGRSTGEALYRKALAGGARALGRRIGAIAPGYRADLVLLDADHPDIAALGPRHALDAYCFVAGKSAIDRVYVSGKCVVENGRHLLREAVEGNYLTCLRRILTA
jgi:formimidoylglutamate deiminase